MATARDFVQDAYGDVLKTLFHRLFDAYNEPATKQEAEQRFSAGVSLALSARDRALKLLPSGS